METRWLAPLIERRVHRYFSKDNDRIMRGMIEDGVRARRAASA